MAKSNMQGKVCLVTGSSSGIGKVTARELAKMGATVVMVCRNRTKGEAAQAEIKEGSDENRWIKGEEKSSIMGAETILTDIGILLLAATFWNYLQLENRLSPARRTWLLIAAIFAMVSILLQLFRR